MFVVHGDDGVLDFECEWQSLASALEDQQYAEYELGQVSWIEWPAGENAAYWSRFTAEQMMRGKVTPALLEAAQADAMLPEWLHAEVVNIGSEQ